MAFRTATKARTRARIALVGPAGSGKTYTALRWATVLRGEKRIYVIDAERGTSERYATRPGFPEDPSLGRFDFEVDTMGAEYDRPDYRPDRFIACMKDAIS